MTLKKAASKGLLTEVLWVKNSSKATEEGKYVEKNRPAPTSTKYIVRQEQKRGRKEASWPRTNSSPDSARFVN